MTDPEIKTSLVPARYARASVCKCGFSVLRDEIPLGTIYEIDPLRMGTAIFVCGGCGAQKLVEVVWCAPWGFIPSGLFDLIRN